MYQCNIPLHGEGTWYENSTQIKNNTTSALGYPLRSLPVTAILHYRFHLSGFALDTNGITGHVPFSVWLLSLTFACETLLMQILALGICVLWQQWTNSHGLQKSCGEKGTAWPLSKREGVRARESPQESQTPAQTGFYCLSGYITSRMVLIYYAQVYCR